MNYYYPKLNKQNWINNGDIIMTTRQRKNTEADILNSLAGKDFLSRLEELYGITNPFPWQVLTRRQLTSAIGIHTQTMANWEIRGKGPKSTPRGTWKQNKSYYPIANVIAWLDQKPSWEVYQNWLETECPSQDVQSQSHCQSLIEQLIATNTYKQPQWKRKLRFKTPNFSFEKGVFL